MIKREVIVGPCRLLLGDCREILPTLGKYDAVVTDPPYGIGYTPYQPNAYEYPPMHEDNAPFEPEFLTHFKNVIIWGANNFSEKLPRGGWLVWDKRVCEAADRCIGSPFELAWSSISTLFKIARIQHGGAVNADGAGVRRCHPTQKPVALMRWCIEQLPRDAVTVIDPFMGSGTTGVACIKTGRQFTGIEIDETYFDIAVRRCREAWGEGSLFHDVAKQEQSLFAGAV
jgi:site-specific DNA-methyltransferase (adenine-specific)